MDTLLLDLDPKEQVILKKIDNIFVLILNKKANTITTDFVRSIHEKLDEIEKYEGECALMTVSSSTKIFSAGLDLNFLMTISNYDQQNFIQEYIRLLGRFTVFPVPTVACLSGHSIAGGFMLAMAHDYRLMRDGKGFLYLNEVINHMPLPRGMIQNFKSKLNPQLVRDLVITGKQIDLEYALEQKVIDQKLSSDKYLQEAFEYTQTLTQFGLNKENMGRLKGELYHDQVEASFNYGLSNGIRIQWKSQGPSTPKL